MSLEESVPYYFSEAVMIRNESISLLHIILEVVGIVDFNVQIQIGYTALPYITSENW